MIRGFCSLVLFCVITTTVSCFITPKRHADYRSPFSWPSHRKVGRTDLLTTARQGYTLDSCESSSECKGLRSCLKDPDLNLPCPGDDSCSCFPSNSSFVFCTNQDKCETGETCATSGTEFPPHFPACVSSEVAKARGLTVVNDPPGDGYSRDVCSDTEDCQDDRICRYAFDTDQLCNDRDPCFCIFPNNLLPTTVCCSETGETTPCVPQEVCAELTTSNSSAAVCISPLAVAREAEWQLADCINSPRPSPTKSPMPSRDPTPSPSNSPVSSNPPPSPASSSTSSPPTETPQTPTFVPELPPPPCIAVNQLHHLQESQLVFQRHPWSKVLCDAQTSCATAGHIIIYQNQPMMMSTYCKIVGCVTRVMQVNSPRYRRKLSVPSVTNGLEFTSFAARYETSLEQYMFTIAVRMGL